jgi:hypothetical protein
MTVQPAVKDIIFFGAFAVLFALYGLIVGGAFLGYTQTSTFIMISINEMTPVILENVPLPGELGPIIFGFVLGVTAPRRASLLQTLIILALGVGLWLTYFHLQYFFEKGAAKGFLLDSEEVGPGEIDGAIQTLSTFASSMRSFAGVVLSAVLGLRFNDDVQLFSSAKGGKTAGGGLGAAGAAGGAGAGPGAGGAAVAAGAAAAGDGVVVPPGAEPMGGAGIELVPEAPVAEGGKPAG